MLTPAEMGFVSDLKTLYNRMKSLLRRLSSCIREFNLLYNRI